MSTSAKGYLYALLAMFGWGTGFIALKIMLSSVTPGSALCLRYIVATLVLLLFYRKVPRPRIKKGDGRYIFFIGVVGYFGAIFIQQIGTDLISASMSSLINTMTPVGILFLSIPLLGERATKRKTLAILMTVAGAVIIVGAAGEGNSLTGILLSSCGMLLWATTSVIIRKTCASYDGIWITIYGQAIAALCALPLPILQIVSDSAERAPFGWPHFLALLYFGAICTAGANLWWTKALERNDANSCSMFYAFLPLSTAIFGVLLLHETLSLNFYVGATVIVAGMLIGAGEKAGPSQVAQP